MRPERPCGARGAGTSLKDERLSFLAMNFFRCSTVAWAEQRIHLRFRPRSLLLLHSRQMLTFGREAALGGSPGASAPWEPLTAKAASLETRNQTDPSPQEGNFKNHCAHIV